MADDASLKKEVGVLYSKTQSDVSSILSNLYRTQAYLEATDLMGSLKQKHDNLLRVESILKETKSDICEFLKHSILSEGKVKELRDHFNDPTKSPPLPSPRATDHMVAEPPPKKLKSDYHERRDLFMKTASFTAQRDSIGTTSSSVLKAGTTSKALVPKTALPKGPDMPGTSLSVQQGMMDRVVQNDRSTIHSPVRVGALSHKPIPDHGAVVKERRVRNTKNKTCPICNKFFLKPSILMKHMRTHDPNRPKFTCYYCLKDFLHSETVYEHWRRFHSDAVLLKCLVKNCKLHFQTLKDLRGHMSSHRTCVRCGVACTVLHQCQVAAMEKWKCTHEECEHCFETWEELLQHLTGSHYHLCGVCSICFVLKPNFDAHVSIFHGGLKAYMCPVCSTEFDNISDFKSHFNDGEKVDMYGSISKCQLFVCHRCGKTFDAISKLLEHSH